MLIGVSTAKEWLELISLSLPLPHSPSVCMPYHDLMYCNTQQPSVE